MKTFLQGIGYVFVFFWLLGMGLGSEIKFLPNLYMRIWFCVTMGFATSILFNHIEKDD